MNDHGFPEKDIFGLRLALEESWRRIMWLTFGDYCRHRDGLLGEMAQSRGDPKGIQIHLDDQDRDFIAQAVAQGITEVSALRTRYTLLLQDRPGESGPVRFFASGRTPFKTVHIERTHLKHLQDKLRGLGAGNVAEHGLTPLEDIGPADTAAYYNAAFGRQNASDILRRGKPIEINYGRGGVEATVILKRGANAAAATGPKPTQGPGRGRAAVVRPVPNDWSTSYLRSLFNDPGRREEVAEFLTPHDFAHVWRAVRSLVGDTGEPGKYILPEVWEAFQKALPGIGGTVVAGVFRQLRQFDPSALENIPEIKQAVMQTTAMILSNPLRGGKARSGDFLRDVEKVFSNRGELLKLALSYTAQGHLRKVSGINTTNTRRREIGGLMTANMGREDGGNRSDVEIEAELSRLEPAIDRIRAKLQRSKWDTGALTGQEFDLFTQYEDLTRELQRFQSRFRGGRWAAGAASPARKPTVHPQQARMDQVEAELKLLEPRVRPILAKLDAAHWDTSRITDDEWELFRHYDRLEKEMRRLKGMPLVDVDDLNVAAAAQHHFRRQSVGTRNEGCTPVLDFRAWCRERRSFEHGMARLGGHGSASRLSDRNDLPLELPGEAALRWAERSRAVVLEHHLTVPRSAHGARPLRLRCRPPTTTPSLMSTTR